MRRVLVLRPEPGASATVARALKLGLDAVAMPLFEVEPIEWQAPDPGPFDGLLLTSANAVRHGGDELSKLRGLAVYVVGEATAEAAREAGFDIAATGDGGIDRLFESIEPDLKLLHLCGEEVREATTTSQPVTRIPIYRARTIDAPDLGSIGGAVALIHSPRAGRRFAELVERRGSIAIAAVSSAALEQVGGGWETAEAADAPTDDALLALAARLCNTSSPK